MSLRSILIWRQAFDFSRPDFRIDDGLACLQHSGHHVREGVYHIFFSGSLA